MTDVEHGGILAARALAAEGIDTMFALPGGHNLLLFEGARVAGIRLIDNDRLILTPGRQLVEETAEGLAICGVGDYREDDGLDFWQALADLPNDMVFSPEQL